MFILYNILKRNRQSSPTDRQTSAQISCVRSSQQRDVDVDEAWRVSQVCRWRLALSSSSGPDKHTSHDQGGGGKHSHNYRKLHSYVIATRTPCFFFFFCLTLPPPPPPPSFRFHYLKKKTTK